MMFNYAKTRLGTFWRTKSSLMMVLRRRLREAIRDDEELNKVLLVQLKDVMDSGDVDNVDKVWHSTMSSWHKILSKIDDAEEFAFMSEERPLKPLAEIAFFLHRLIVELQTLFQKTKDDKVKRVLSGLVEKILIRKEKLMKLFSSANDDLHKEYVALLRQDKEERGSLQNFVLAYDEIMQVMSEAWGERSETKKVEHEADSIDDALKRTLVKLESYVHGKLELKVVETECNRLYEDVDKVVTKTEAMLKGFLFMLKAMSDLYLKYDIEIKAKSQETLTSLEKNGFPEKDLLALKNFEKENEKKNHKATDVIVNAFRRMARKESKNFTDAIYELKAA